jgi:hypothetical protein
MSTDSPRDTHFLGFAEAQLDELVHTYFEDIPMMDRFWEDTKKKVELLLARRAYDLALHMLEASGMSEGFAEGFIRGVPDLTELPPLEQEPQL